MVSCNTGSADEKITASSIAAEITSIPDPISGETALSLPVVPEGYTIKIKSSSDADVVTIDNVILPAAAETVVSIILTVTNTDNNNSADTKSINVKIYSITALSNCMASDQGISDQGLYLYGAHFKNWLLNNSYEEIANGRGWGGSDSTCSGSINKIPIIFLHGYGSGSDTLFRNSRACAHGKACNISFIGQRRFTNLCRQPATIGMVSSS